MMNKVLIVAVQDREAEELEQILQEVVEGGGELFFANTTVEGLTILKREHPQLVFLDADLLEDEEKWLHDGVHIVLMCSKEAVPQASEDILIKPFKPYQVLEKCHGSLGQAASSQVPPM